MSSVNHFNLIVVGGGVSGLSTVCYLLKNQFSGNIGLLEARNRFGGRILTTKTKIEEEKIELGANWIHGIINNPIYEILYKNQVIDFNTNENKSCYNLRARTYDGKDIEIKLIQQVTEAYSNILNGTSQFIENHLEIANSYKDSVGKYLINEIENWIEKFAKNSENINFVRGLFDSLLKRETCINGCNSMDDVSLQYYQQYKEYLGGNMTISRGYYSLIQVLLNNIDEMDDNQQFNYFFDHQITKIKWPGLSSKRDQLEDFFISIECSNGSIFKCKHLILTQSLGCLKKHLKQLFDPPLPQYKLDCVERMGFDVVDKVFLEYSSKSTISNAFTQDGAIIDEILILWNNSDENKKHWYQKIYSIYRITDHCIQVWVSGDEARTLENLDEAEINAQLTEQFRSIFNDDHFPKADNVIVTRWGMDPFSNGSYSFISNKSSPEDIDRLASPIYLNPDDELVSL